MSCEKLEGVASAERGASGRRSPRQAHEGAAGDGPTQREGPLAAEPGGSGYAAR